MEEIIIKRDGLRLYGILERAEGEKTPLVIMTHGIMGDCGYDENSFFNGFYFMAQKFKAAGYSSLRFDFNGNGKSEGEHEDMTVLSEILDEIKVLQYVKDLDFVSDIYLMGYSQGGVVASMVAGYFREEIKGVMLLAPAAVLRENCEVGNMIGIPYDPYKPPRVITLNLMKDFRIGEAYMRTGRTLPIYETAAQYEGPVCLVRGDDDVIVPLYACEKYAEVYKNCTFHKLPTCDHMTICPDERTLDLLVDFIKSLD